MRQLTDRILKQNSTPLVPLALRRTIQLGQGQPFIQHVMFDHFLHPAEAQWFLGFLTLATPSCQCPIIYLQYVFMPMFSRHMENKPVAAELWHATRIAPKMVLDTSALLAALLEHPPCRCFVRLSVLERPCRGWSS